MPYLHRLIDGYRRFRDQHWARERERWAELAEGQSPEVMILACADSRSDPAEIFDARPGEIFVARNIAALAPPYETSSGFHGVSAALEFAVTQLEVGEILVMRANVVARSAQHPHPVGDEMALAGLGIVELAGQRRSTTAAESMAEHEDFADVELGDGELERGGDAVKAAARLVGWGEGRNVADDEHLAGACVEDVRGVHPAVGAGEDHDLGTLPLGKFGPAYALARPVLLAKAAIAFDEIVEVRHRIVRYRDEGRGGKRAGNIGAQSLSARA